MVEQSQPMYVVMAKIGAPYGVAGWVKVNPHTAEIDALADYSNWYIGTKSAWQSIEVEAIKPYQKGLLVKFAPFDSPEAVASLTNQLIAVKRSDLPVLAEDEGYYWADLEGCQVIDHETQAKLGVVDYLYESDDYDVMLVKSDTGAEYHLPFVEEAIVQSVDTTNKQIVVDWPSDEAVEE